MPETQTPIAVEQLGQVFGPSIGYHISQCRHGGYLVIVDGAVYAARSTLAEAIGVMGQVAAGQYGESPVPPEQAQDVTPAPGPGKWDHLPDGPPRVVRPPQMQHRAANDSAAKEPDLAERARATVSLALAFLAAGLSAVVGV